MNQKTNSQRGFTMVEMLVVFTIMGMVGAYMMGSSFLAARQRARDATRKTDLVQVAKLLELYVNDHPQYPASISFGDPLISVDGNTTYIQKLPTDPRDPDRNYVYRSNGTSWQLYTLLEREDDPDVDNNGDGTYDPADDDFTFVSCSPAGANCNYGISSSDITPDTDPLP